VTQKLVSICVVTLCSLVGLFGTAEAENLSSRDRSVILLHVISDKGFECGLLDKWESMVIKTQARQERRDWDKVRRQRAAEAIANDMAEKDCDDGAVTGWIDAARPNLSAEGLAPFLVMYQELAKLEKPPAPFDSATMRLDYSAPIARIEAEFARLEAIGRVAEGGQGWDDYRAGLKIFLDDAVASYEAGEPANSPKSREALTYMSLSGQIVETWLAETAGD